MDTDAVAACRDTFGIEPDAVEAISGRTVFRIRVGGRDVVVKLAGGTWDTSSPLVEARAYSLAARRGALVPDVLGVADDYLVVGLLAGRSLWDGDVDPAVRAGVWRRAGEDLRRIHELALPGFGTLVQAGDGIGGAGPRWCPMVRDARDRGLRTLADAGCLDPAHARTLERRYDELEDALHSCTDGRLLHGDLEGGHVFADGDRYAGMIDFGQAQSGDPHWDLARVTLWDGDESLELVLDGYGRDTLTKDERRWKLPLYRVARAVLAHVDWLAHAKGGGESFEQSRYADLL